MKVSVIIPTYNRKELLATRALPSVFAQTNQDFEVLVIGDGTDDETVEYMAHLDDARVRFWNLPRATYPENPDHAWGFLGLTSLNFGLDNARGEWISVLNDDDRYEPDNFEVLLAAATETGAEFVYGRSDTWKGRNPQPTGQMYGAWPPGDGQITQGSYLYRSSLPYRYDWDCWTRGRNGDADMWIRMYEGGVKFHYLPRLVHHYHPNPR